MSKVTDSKPKARIAGTRKTSVKSNNQDRSTIALEKLGHAY